MSYFTPLEIFNSIVSAVVFGAIFAILSDFARLLFKALIRFGEIPDLLFEYEGSLARVVFRDERDTGCGRVGSLFRSAAAFVQALLFSLGYLLISYVFLDGTLRVYILALSGLSFLLSGRLSRAVTRVTLKPFFEMLLRSIIILLRLLFYPTRMIAGLLYVRVWPCLPKKVKKCKNNVSKTASLRLTSHL